MNNSDPWRDMPPAAVRPKSAAPTQPSYILPLVPSQARHRVVTTQMNGPDMPAATAPPIRQAYTPSPDEVLMAQLLPERQDQTL